MGQHAAGRNGDRRGYQSGRDEALRRGLPLDAAEFLDGRPGGYDIAAWSVAGGTVLWTSSYPPAKVYLLAAIALNRDGTRLFVTGSWPNHGVTTVAYHA